MGMTGRDLAAHLYTRSMPRDLEAAWVREVFAAYDEAQTLAMARFLPAEVQFSRGYLQRGILERRIARILAGPGVGYRPDFATKRDGTRTSHFGRFIVGDLEVLISAVDDKWSPPRRADFRNSAIAATEIALFDDLNLPAPDANARPCVFFCHGKEEDDSAVPLFSNFKVYDQGGLTVWQHDLFASQLDVVEELLGIIEERLPNDGGIPKLRRRLRRPEQGS